MASLANVGHTIQKIINNTPVSLTVNATTTTVVTNGGSVYQSGLISSRIQQTFHEIFANENIVGHVVSVKDTDNNVYFLNSTGSVFEYDYNVQSCSPIIKEVYSPAACNQDRAIKIDTGRAHAVILTERNKIWGVGCNNNYQLVPQGQCKYESAVELIITDTNLHDNNCCNAFVGTLNELEKPVIPSCGPCEPRPCINPCDPCKKIPDNRCNDVTCIKGEVCGHVLCPEKQRSCESRDNHNSGTDQPYRLEIHNVTFRTKDGHHAIGTLKIPVLIDYHYIGFLCVDDCGNFSGTLTTCVNKIRIPKGCLEAEFIEHHRERDRSDERSEEFEIACEERKISITVCDEVVIIPICNSLSSTTCINGKGNQKITVHVAFSLADLIRSLDIQIAIVNESISLKFNNLPADVRDRTTIISAICDGAFGIDHEIPHKIVLDPVVEVPVKCGAACKKSIKQPELPQPCWVNVYAGFDISVLVDNCNRLYVLGSLFEIRNNNDLLNKSCLENLLSGTNAHINFPADQLNCCTRPRDGNCQCVKCRDQCFKTDLSKFGISISFPEACDDSRNNLCDFLKALKRCNEAPQCNNTCKPCDCYIYLNICGDCKCPCDPHNNSPTIGKITLYNRISVCKLVSQGFSDAENIKVSINSLIDFDLNKYCVDGDDVPLDKVVILDFGVKGPHVDLFLDVSRPGGILFTANGDRKKCNVEFSVDASSRCHRFLLNYGNVLDPVELTNLKCAFALDPCFPCPKFKNPFDTKITNTYLIGGDHVRFIINCPSDEDPCHIHDPHLRLAVTPDIPTVFRLHRRVLDVAVGHNNLSVLVGGLACPNEIYVLGNNCDGQLGIGSNETIVCWKQVNRCLFDCQVNAIFPGPVVNFYVTQSSRVYAAGQWKCLVDSNIPVAIQSFLQAWKTKQIAVSKNQIVLLSSDGCVFGLGDNSLGELGLCHTECVSKPTPLIFFTKLNQCVARQLCTGLIHPVEQNLARHENNRGFSRKYNNNNEYNVGAERGCGYERCSCKTVEKYKIKESCRCETCFDEPCRCEVPPPFFIEPPEIVRYTRRPHGLLGKKYLPNGRCSAYLR